MDAPSPVAPGQVGPVARALGFAGLLPQAALVAGMIVLRPGTQQARELFPLTVLYAAIILSFLGGLWWSIAMRREVRQGQLATLSVLPSLLAAALYVWAGAAATGWPAAALGVAIMLTLLIDRRLVTTGEAPSGWMGLRVPLSLGLGLLTIAAGALAG